MTSRHSFMHAISYKKCWNVPNKNICSMVKVFLKHGRLLRDLNRTNITFIPKKDKPEKVNEYRPISLFNISYKFISKLIANRLRLVLPKIISPLRSLFVQSRDIHAIFLFPMKSYLLLTENGKARDIWPLNFLLESLLW